AGLGGEAVELAVAVAVEEALVTWLDGQVGAVDGAAGGEDGGARDDGEATAEVVGVGWTCYLDEALGGALGGCDGVGAGVGVDAQVGAEKGLGGAGEVLRVCLDVGAGGHGGRPVGVRELRQRTGEKVALFGLGCTVGGEGRERGGECGQLAG